MAEPLATTDDVEALWRPLSEAETAVAEVLIRIASRVIRARYPDVDDRIVSGSLDAQDVADVVASMVKRAMLNPVADGVESQSQAAGPFSVSNKYSNPNGNIYLSAEERLLFDPAGTATGRSLNGWLA